MHTFTMFRNFQTVDRDKHFLNSPQGTIKRGRQIEDRKATSRHSGLWSMNALYQSTSHPQPTNIQSADSGSLLLVKGPKKDQWLP